MSVVISFFSVASVVCIVCMVCMVWKGKLLAMRTLMWFTVGIAGLASLLGDARPVHAKALPWTGTMTLELGSFAPGIGTGGGVATLNNSAGNLLQTLRLADGIGLQTAIPVTDPESTGTVQSFRADLTLGTATLGNLDSLTPNPGTLPIGGQLRLCLLFPDCANNISADLSAGLPTTGFGVGGLITMGAAGPVRVSIDAAPWQIGAATRLTGFSTTLMTQTATRMRTGFVHGPGSNTTSAAQAGGVVQLITPMQVRTKGFGGANNDNFALFSSLTVQFVPEPGLLLLLGTGIVALAFVGRSRTRR